MFVVIVKLDELLEVFIFKVIVLEKFKVKLGIGSVILSVFIVFIDSEIEEDDIVLL